MLRAAFPAVLALLALLPAPGSAAVPAAPALVRDLDPRSGGGVPATQFFRAGARTLFVVQDAGFVGTGELWSTDGTPAGTGRLRSFPGYLRILGTAGDAVLFATPILVNSAFTEPSRLWRSDGTREGTFELGPVLGADLTSRDPQQSPALALGNAVLFSGCTPAGGCEPWTSDGTPEGTRRLREIVPGPGSSAPYGFMTFAGRGWFFAGSASGPGLWQTDGTTRGTQEVLALPPFASPRHLFVQGSRMYFTEGVGDFGNAEGAHLWTSDGTAAGTHPVLPFAPTRGGGAQVISLLPGLGDRAVFVGVRGRGDFELWITDPAARSAHPLTHVAPLPHGGYLPFGGTAAAGGRLLFTVSGRLWTSRGSPADTRPLDGCPHGCPAPATIWGTLPAPSGRVLFLVGGTGADPSSLWTTDGTGAGTRKVTDLCTGSCNGAPQLAGILHGRAYFYFADQLWVTDGSAAGTLALADRPVMLFDYNLPPPIFAVGDRVFFPALSAEGGDELWSTDGTPPGTALLAGLERGASSLPQGFSPFRDGVLFFTCGDQGGEPWYSDGTAQGTVALPGITFCQGGGNNNSPPPRVLRLGDAAFFTAFSSDYVYGFWRTDGTPAGTFPLFVPGADEFLGDATVLRGKLFFITETDTETRFWSSDGTAAGTARLFTLPLRNSFGLTPVGDRVLFQGDDDQGTHFWITDGSAAGTLEFPGVGDPPFLPFAGAFYSITRGSLTRTDLTPAGTQTVFPNDSTPTQLFNLRAFASLGGSLYFVAQSGVEFDGIPDPFALYSSDGTTRGTVAVKELGEDPNFLYNPPAAAVAGGLLYFVAGDVEHGQELWRSDGTAAGTFRIADLQPGPGSSMPAELTAAGDRLFFTADDGEHGRELWVTRGAAGDPQPVGRPTDGTLSLAPQGLTVAGDTLFFSADDEVHGRELWSLPLAPSAASGRR